MMNKTRAAIHGKVESLGINVNVGEGRAYMTTEWPWKYLWLYIENKANIHQIESMRLNNAALSRVKSKGDSIHAKDWEHGEDFTNRGRKCHARSSVMDELEMRSGKQLAKAESVLSSIVSELAEEHGLTEENILSLSTQSRIKTMEASMISASLLIQDMT